MRKDYPLSRSQFNKYILNQTYKYQKKYGFKIGSGPNATWNNEADAFKHAYMQAYLQLRFNKDVTRTFGDFHEWETPNAPVGERNMDLWNNSIGREVADDIKKELGWRSAMVPKEVLYDMAAERICKLMKEGELITSPDDKREFKNIRNERQKLEDRVFYKGELNNYTGEDKEVLLKQYLNQSIDNNGKFPSKAELNMKVVSSDLVYIRDYVRADGTRVHGYYRRRIIH